MPAPTQTNYYFNPRRAALWGIFTTVIAFNLALACLTLIPNVVLATQLAGLCIAILVGGWALYGLSVTANFIMDTVKETADKFRENLQTSLTPALTTVNRTVHIIAQPANIAANATNAVTGAAGTAAGAVLNAAQQVAEIAFTGVTAGVVAVSNARTAAANRKAPPLNINLREDEDGEFTVISTDTVPVLA